MKIIFKRIFSKNKKLVILYTSVLSILLSVSLLMIYISGNVNNNVKSELFNNKYISIKVLDLKSEQLKKLKNTHVEYNDVLDVYVDDYYLSPAEYLVTNTFQANQASSPIHNIGDYINVKIDDLEYTFLVVQNSEKLSFSIDNIKKETLKVLVTFEFEDADIVHKTIKDNDLIDTGWGFIDLYSFMKTLEVISIILSFIFMIIYVLIFFQLLKLLISNQKEKISFYKLLGVKDKEISRIYIFIISIIMFFSLIISILITILFTFIIMFFFRNLLSINLVFSINIWWILFVIIIYGIILIVSNRIIINVPPLIKEEE